MAWTWSYADADGADLGTLEVDGAGTGFPTQSDAESWLGEAWPDLLEAGVDRVWLHEDAREVYGPMSLQPPDA